MDSVKISTITMSLQLPNCKLNLTNIGKYLNIDETIIGIKYNFANVSVLKGTYSTTNYKKAKLKDMDKINKALFYNQITLVVNNNGNQVNVKLFANGSLHITGCKAIDEGKQIVKLLYGKLETIRSTRDTMLLVRDENGVWLDRDGLVYSERQHIIIGHKKGLNTYTINKRDFEIDAKTGLFISKKIQSQRKRMLLNREGHLVGDMRVELLKSDKLYKKGTNVFYDYTNDLVYYNDKTVIGKIVYAVSETEYHHKHQMLNTLEIEYDCCPFADSNFNLDFSLVQCDINCINVYFNIGFQINRIKLYDTLLSLKYVCKYKPESYSGIKLIYKLSMDGEWTGYCKCSMRCTCRKITFMIFQSGNVIATGFKNYHEIDKVTKQFINLCVSNKELVSTVGC